ncbi:hypothetical protein HDV04_005784 [Boothiomyces sp. JEL0838]|nr:hypothetical protein HDV04_005784 [Boothiomyces sp. JEL0838]
MNEFSTSFAVLVTALESVKALKETKKSPEPIRPIVHSMKRKRSFQDDPDPKHQRLTPDLSYRFAQTVNLIQPEHRSKISKRTMLHLERMAHNNPMQFQSLLNQWNSKLEELESNISMITKNISDSYDDIRIIVTRITSLIDWLVPDKEELKNALPSYKYAEHVLENLTRFVKIVEDMKNTNGKGYITGNLSRDTDVMLDLILTKKKLYGDSLRHDCLAWKVLGYPVQDLQSTIMLFKDTFIKQLYSEKKIHIIETPTSSQSSLFPADQSGQTIYAYSLYLKGIELALDLVTLIGKNEKQLFVGILNRHVKALMTMMEHCLAPPVIASFLKIVPNEEE